MRIEDYHEYCLEDFEIKKFEETFGPVWVLTPKVGPLMASSYAYQKSFVLRSDIKMDKSWNKTAKAAVHLDTAHGEDPGRQIRGWKGAYTTESMDEAVSFLIADLNENQRLEILSDAMQESSLELADCLSKIDEATVEFPRQDLEQVMKDLAKTYQGLVSCYLSTKAEVDRL